MSLATPNSILTSAEEDDQLMVRLMSGDDSAARAICYKYEGRLMGLFLHSTKDHHTSEDLTQESLLVALVKSNRYQPDGKFENWIIAVAKNKLLDLLRRQEHDPIYLSTAGTDDENDITDALFSNEPLPEKAAMSNEFMERMTSCLEQLSPIQKTTFTLRHFEGYKFREIADLLNTNLRTAMSNCRLAKEKLQKLLASELN